MCVHVCLCMLRLYFSGGIWRILHEIFWLGSFCLLLIDFPFSKRGKKFTQKLARLACPALLLLPLFIWIVIWLATKNLRKFIAKCICKLFQIVFQTKWLFSTTFSFRSAYWHVIRWCRFCLHFQCENCIFFDQNQMLKTFFLWTLKMYEKLCFLICMIRSWETSL